MAKVGVSCTRKRNSRSSIRPRRLVDQGHLSEHLPLRSGLHGLVADAQVDAAADEAVHVVAAVPSWNTVSPTASSRVLRALMKTPRTVVIRGSLVGRGEPEVAGRKTSGCETGERPHDDAHTPGGSHRERK